MNNLTVQPIQAGEMTRAGNSAGIPQGSETGFSEVLKKSLDAVNREAVEADHLVQGLAQGEHANIHETMIAMEKAGISLRLMTKVQQKVVDAYREIMRLQL